MGRGERKTGKVDGNQIVEVRELGHCVTGCGIYLMILNKRPTSNFHFRKITLGVSVQDGLEKRKCIRYLLVCY